MESPDLKLAPALLGLLLSLCETIPLEGVRDLSSFLLDEDCFIFYPNINEVFAVMRASLESLLSKV